MPAIFSDWHVLALCGSGFSREYQQVLFAAKAAPTMSKTTSSVVKKKNHRGHGLLLST